VWDEFVGFWITMIAVPVSFCSLVAGFVLFRLFDIWKPWPIRALDSKVHGGLGIMLDDCVAGVFALICLQVWMAWFPACFVGAG
jgi:phosphatidylglycerophosphatase A